MSSFKSNHPLDQRKNEAFKMLSKYTDRIPIIIDKYDKNLPIMDRYKYLVPSDLTIGHFLTVVRQRIKLKSEQGLFIIINNTMPPVSEMLSITYKKHKDEDGFLYVSLHSEKVFG